MRHDQKMRRKAERKERAATDPWFGKKRVTDFQNKKRKASKQACRGNNATKEWQ